jgi:hypothetical protein
MAESFDFKYADLIFWYVPVLDNLLLVTYVPIPG